MSRDGFTLSKNIVSSIPVLSHALRSYDRISNARSYSQRTEKSKTAVIVSGRGCEGSNRQRVIALSARGVIIGDPVTTSTLFTLPVVGFTRNENSALPSIRACTARTEYSGSSVLDKLVSIGPHKRHFSF